MKLFQCQYCGQLLYFENAQCDSCGRRLGYLPTLHEVTALEPESDHWRALAAPELPFRLCANAEYRACNWLIPAEAPDLYCIACRHNRIVPDLSQPRNLERWRQLETAKHRLFYTLLRLGLVPATKAESASGLAFDFLADPAEDTPHAPTVLTGHESGLITINIAEADHVERERRRRDLGEPYRTLLGHFRHEIGHYFWAVLVRDDPSIEPFRRIFGDERTDYAGALRTYYAEGAPPAWESDFVTAYATAHPWEDFAETWAHYLHMIDTLETANAFGLSVQPTISPERELSAFIDFDSYRTGELDRLIGAWLPLTFAVNSLNRSMGQFDLYPFVLSPTVIAKLGFVHERINVATGRPHRSSSGQDVLKAVIAGLRYRVAAPHTS